MFIFSLCYVRFLVCVMWGFGRVESSLRSLAAASRPQPPISRGSGGQSINPPGGVDLPKSPPPYLLVCTIEISPGTYESLTSIGRSAVDREFQYIGMVAWRGLETLSGALGEPLEISWLALVLQGNLNHQKHCNSLCFSLIWMPWGGQHMKKRYNSVSFSLVWLFWGGQLCKKHYNSKCFLTIWNSSPDLHYHVHGVQFGPSLTRAPDLFVWRELTTPSNHIRSYHIFMTSCHFSSCRITSDRIKLIWYKSLFFFDFHEDF